MESDNHISVWIIVVLIISLFVVDHYSYKRGYEEGRKDQIEISSENIEQTCKDTLQDRMYEFCEVATQNHIEYNLSEICTDGDYISIDNCYERISEAKSNEQSDFQSQIEEQETSNETMKDKLEEQQEFIDAQKDYQDCVSLSTNSKGYIKPNDEEFCRNMYLR